MTARSGGLVVSRRSGSGRRGRTEQAPV